MSRLLPPAAGGCRARRGGLRSGRSLPEYADLVEVRPPATPIASAAATPTSVGTADPKLRKELPTVLAAEQADRSDPGEAGVAGDRARTERLGRDRRQAWLADLGELAYLTDRVAANARQPQTNGNSGAHHTTALGRSAAWFTGP